MLSDLRIQYRISRSVGTGKYYTNSRGNRKEIMEYKEFYQTPLGEIDTEEWRQRVESVILEEGLDSFLEKIIVYCETHCLWLRNDQEIKDYAMECLIDGTYLHWNDFDG